MSGIDTLLLISTNAEPDRRLQQHLNAISAAKQCGVSRVLYTSYTGARRDSLFSLARSHAQTEMAVQASGMTYTILRNAQYAEALNVFIMGSLGANCVIMPSAKSMVTYVPRQNAAQAAAGAMLGAGHDNRIYEITGSHALSGSEIASLIGEARGKTPELVEAEAWEFLQATTVPFGAPRFMVRAAEELWEAASRGEYAQVSGDARSIAVGKLMELPDYVRKIARAGLAT